MLGATSCEDTYHIEWGGGRGHVVMVSQEGWLRHAVDWTRHSLTAACTAPRTAAPWADHTLKSRIYSMWPAKVLVGGLLALTICDPGLRPLLALRSSTAHDHRPEEPRL